MADGWIKKLKHVFCRLHRLTGEIVLLVKPYKNLGAGKIAAMRLAEGQLRIQSTLITDRGTVHFSSSCDDLIQVIVMAAQAVTKYSQRQHEREDSSFVFPMTSLRVRSSGKCLIMAFEVVGGAEMAFLVPEDLKDQLVLALAKAAGLTFES